MRERCVELARRIGRDPDEVVEWWAERAAIREIDGGQVRDDAERDAFEELRATLEEPRATLEPRKGPRSADAPVATAGKREESS